MSDIIARTLSAILPAVLVCGLAGTGRAQEPVAEGTLLTVRSLSGVVHTYRRSDLALMRRVSFTTTTIWTEGRHQFSGVPLSEILQDAGVEVGDIDLYAANDYVATIPLSEVEPDAPIVADLYDGAPMSLRDKGPLWVVYPYDADRRYQSETSYTRSVWQLVRIEAVPTPGN